MKRNELFILLRSFSKKEIQSFRKFLISPYFGDKRKIYLLYSEIIKYYPLFTDMNLNNRSLSKNVYPGKKYNDSTIRNLLSDLHESALYFLQMENFRNSWQDGQNFLFRELNSKGLIDEFFKATEKLDFFNDDLVDWSYLLNKHFAETHKFNFSYRNIKLNRKTVLQKEISYLNNSINYLIYFFITEIVSHYLIFMIYEKSYNTENVNNNIKQVFSLFNIDNIKQALKDDKNSFIIDVYSELIRAFSDLGNDFNYYKYKNRVLENFSRLSKDEIRFHYYQLVTYCNFKIRLKHPGYEEEQFNLYKEMLENSYYLDRNTKYLPHDLYRGILNHGIRMKNYEFIGNFVNNYSRKTSPADRQNMYSYGSAYLYFHLGNFDKSLKHIKDIDQEFFVYKIDVRNLTLRNYFELGYYEEVLSLTKSYREFIRRNKLVNTELRKLYINFSKYLDKIILYSESTKKKDLGYLSYMLKKNNEVAFKQWLLEKISILQSNIKKTG